MSNKYYHGLTKSMMFTIILVSFTPLLTITFLAGYQYSVAYKSRVVAHLRELVLKHDQSIDYYLKEKTAEIQVLAAVEGIENLKNEARLEALHNSLLRHHRADFVDLGLVNSKGIQVTYVGPFNLRGANYADAQWFKNVQEHQIYISDVFLGLRGVPHFIIAVLIESEGEKWVLRTTLDFIAFNTLVEDIRIGETGLAFIINRKGEFQTTPRKNIINEIPFLKKLAAGKNEFSGLLHRRASISMKINPATGRETIFVISPIKSGNWLMIYQQDVSDAFSDLNQAKNIAAVILLFGGVAIVVMAYLMSRRMARKVELADIEKGIMNEQVIEAGKLASVGELAAGIAHEINNPVAIMVEEAGWIQDLLAEGLYVEDNEREVLRALNQIRSQGIRCKDITHKLLSFAHKIDPTIIRVKLNDLIYEMAELCEQRAKYANVNIETSLADNLPEIAASPSELQQVFLNLINNAIDSMDPKGGELDIATRFESGVVVVSISDTGCGIPKSNLSRIFDPFFTTKPVGKGTGLGLSIIYGIISKMKGEISVKSALDKGTVFTIKLPAAEAE
ncbi:sensor histidine kinase [Maridesulfovibrio zosterae]|uniref:sensor histidine kinase n=1 Tax=Maridesulfovibrio zosterae TaxID=82171 RepID=UPI000416ABA5|nr:ATP-binding protein [Maridesulfovibrio zosterae]